MTGNCERRIGPGKRGRRIDSRDPFFSAKEQFIHTMNRVFQRADRLGIMNEVGFFYQSFFASSQDSGNLPHLTEIIAAFRRTDNWFT